MTSRPTRDRCEVCATRLDPDHTGPPRRCTEHVDQIALFAPPPAELLRRRPTRAQPATSDTSGDRHPSRARRTHTASKD